MKKTVCLLLALIMVFGLFGCVKTPEQPTDAPSGETGTTPEPSGAGLSFSLPSLPEIGEYYDGEKTDDFFADGVHGAFEPRDDYGPLSLYFADVTYYRDMTCEGGDWDGSAYMCDYGLMTQDGRIVTGANWNDGVLTQMDDETGFFQLRQRKPGSEYGYDYHTDLIALDGSWAMHFDRYISTAALFRFGLPYFIITDAADRAVYSAKDGSPVLSLKAYVPADTDYAYVPNVVIYADENMLLLLTENEYVREGLTRNGYTALDWDGNVLYTKELENRDLNPFDADLNNGTLLRLTAYYENGHFRLLNAMCEPVSDTDYDYVTFDEHSGYTLAVTGSGNGIRADYFDKDGNAVFPDTGWTPAALNRLENDEYWSSGNDTVFCDTTSHLFLDFFGNEIELPAAANYVTVLDDYESGRITLYMRGEDGFGYLLAPDGKLLMKIDPPYEWQYTGDSARYVTLTVGFGRALAVYEDGGVKVFDLSTGTELLSGTLEDFFGPGTDAKSYRENGSLWFLSGSLLCARQSAANRSTVYDLNPPRVLCKGVVSTRYEHGIVLLATPAECLALDKDGNVLYRAENGKMA